VVALLGEPGIGKTALCQQVIEHAVGRGFRTVVGHCYEGGARSQPYLPLLEVLHTLVLELSEQQLLDAAGDRAASLGRLLPEIRSRLLLSAEPAASDPDIEAWQLVSGLTGFLRVVAEQKPLVVIFEDMHDATHEAANRDESGQDGFGQKGQTIWAVVVLSYSWRGGQACLGHLDAGHWFGPSS
jgi:predicted ATPase